MYMYIVPQRYLEANLIVSRAKPRESFNRENILHIMFADQLMQRSLCNFPSDMAFVGNIFKGKNKKGRQNDCIFSPEQNLLIVAVNGNSACWIDVWF